MQKLNHKSGIITEFEWTYGNYKDWFVPNIQKDINLKDHKIIFPDVSCYMTYQRLDSRETQNSIPIIKIYNGPFYEGLMGFRFKGICEEPFRPEKLEIKIEDGHDLFQDYFSSFYFGNLQCFSDYEIYGRISCVKIENPSTRRPGHSYKVFSLEDFSVAEHDKHI